MNDFALQELARRIKASDYGAFETIFNLHHVAIFNFLLFKTKDPAISEDLVQEVFFRIWKSRANIDETKSLKNYLYTIADNLSLNHLRHLKVIARHQEESSIKLFTEADMPDFILEEKEWHANLMHAIEALPEKPRMVFLMSRFDDLTYHQIAEALSISVKTVEGHMSAALKKLREKLSKKL